MDVTPSAPDLSPSEEYKGTAHLNHHARWITTVLRNITEDVYHQRGYSVDPQLPYGLAITVADGEQAKARWRENSTRVEAVLNALRAAGWDDVQYDAEHGQITARVDPFRAVTVETVGGERYRSWAGGVEPEAYAATIVREGFRAYMRDGGWRYIPAHNIAAVEWPAQR